MSLKTQGKKSAYLAQQGVQVYPICLQAIEVIQQCFWCYFIGF